MDWILHPDAESNLFWSTFLLNYPDKKTEVQEAERFIRSLQVREKEISDERMAASLQKIGSRIAAANTPTIPTKTRSLTQPVWYKVAAVFVLAIVSAGLIWSLIGKASEVTYATAYGEIKNIVLPDGSSVTLNAYPTSRLAARSQPGSVVDRRGLLSR